jgi:hypothetical protein
MNKTVNGVLYSSLAIGTKGYVSVSSLNEKSREWTWQWGKTIEGEFSPKELERVGMYQFLESEIY